MTPWTVAHQASLSMRFFSKNTGVGCHFLLQGIFPTQGSNLCLLLGRWILYHRDTCARPLLDLPSYSYWGGTNQILQTSSEVCWWENILKAIRFVNHTKWWTLYMNFQQQTHSKQWHVSWAATLCDNLTKEFSLHPEHQGKNMANTVTVSNTDLNQQNQNLTDRKSVV